MENFWTSAGNVSKFVVPAGGVWANSLHRHLSTSTARLLPRFLSSQTHRLSGLSAESHAAALAEPPCPLNYDFAPTVPASEKRESPNLADARANYASFLVSPWRLTEVRFALRQRKFEAGPGGNVSSSFL